MGRERGKKEEKKQYFLNKDSCILVLKRDMKIIKIIYQFIIIDNGDCSTLRTIINLLDITNQRGFPSAAT